MTSNTTALTSWRNAAAEAQAMLPRGDVPRRAYALEPSPPAMGIPPYFADDPAVPGSGCPGDHAGRPAPDGLAGTVTVTPTSAGEVTWQQLAGDGGDLGDLERPLMVDAELTAFLGDWFGFAFSVLEELRLAPGARDIGRTQLWPGHFDPAVEITAGPPGESADGPRAGGASPASGAEDASRRATYGASPGDQHNPAPYLYVGPWGGIDADPYWDAESFPGAVLGFEALLSAPDQRRAALEFFTAGYERLSRR